MALEADQAQRSPRNPMDLGIMEADAKARLVELLKLVFSASKKINEGCATTTFFLFHITG